MSGDKRSAVLRMSAGIAADDPIWARDGWRLQIGPGTVRLDLPYEWFATRTDRIEDGDEVWEVQRWPEDQ